MMYYHIIYNSSQRTQEGTVGLGIRSYTEGTPKEYIEALKENGFFSYSSGNMPQPSPKELLENGETILRLPVTYNYAKLFVPGSGKELYVVARIVSVGFDYPYYVKFTAARMDNFVVDAYLFETCPDESVLQVFYEKPQNGNIGFVPRNWVPTPDNEEMKSLSLGQMPLFATEEKRFCCELLQPVSDLSIELLFAYVEANRLNKPLLVKCDNKIAASLMADMMRLLPEQLQKEAFFYVNYQLEGVKDGYKVFFIDDSYNFDYANYGQFYVFDISQSAKVNTAESETYRNEVTGLIRQNNIAELYKRIAWMMNPVYASIRDKSDDVKKVFYNYIVEPKEFKLNDVNNKGEELWMPLKEYFAQDKSNQKLFDEHLSFALRAPEFRGDGFVALLKFVNRLLGFGFDVIGVVNDNKSAVSTKLLETPESFDMALQKIQLSDLKKYFDKSVFEKHGEYLDDKRFAANWPSLYKYFYPSAQQNDHVGIVTRMFWNGLPKNVIDAVVEGFGINDLASCQCFTDVAKKDKALIAYSWKYIWDRLQKQLGKKELLPSPVLAGEIEREVVSPLLKSQNYPDDVRKGYSLMTLLQGKFTKDNFSSLFKSALNIDTKQMTELLYDKGLLFVNESQVDDFVKLILEKLKPDAKDFICKVESHPCKMQMLESFFKGIGENKKNITKMQKDGMLRLSENEFGALTEKLFGSSKKSKDGEKEGKDKLFQILVAAGVAVVIVGVVLICLLCSPKEKPNPEGTSNASLNDTTEMVDDAIKSAANDSIVSSDSLAIDNVQQEKLNDTVEKG